MRSSADLPDGVSRVRYSGPDAAKGAHPRNDNSVASFFVTALGRCRRLLGAGVFGSGVDVVDQPADTRGVAAEIAARNTATTERISTREPSPSA